MDKKTDLTLVTALRSITLDKSYFEMFDPAGGERVSIEVTSSFIPNSKELDEEHGFNFRLDCSIVGKNTSGAEEAADAFRGECIFTGHFAIVDNETISSDAINNSRHYFESQLFPLIRGYIADTLNLMGVPTQGAPWDMEFGRNRLAREENDHPGQQEA